MYVLGDKFAFIAHPRTASRATGKALVAAGCDTHDGHHTAVPKRCEQILADGGIVACTIRNPFDLAVSWYFNWHFEERGVRTKPGEFEPYVLGGFKSGYYVEDNDPYYYGLQWANRVLRFENLEEDLHNLMLEAGMEPVKTEPYGVLERDRDYRVYYNDVTKAAVAKRFATDLLLTGYEF